MWRVLCGVFVSNAHALFNLHAQLIPQHSCTKAVAPRLSALLGVLDVVVAAVERRNCTVDHRCPLLRLLRRRVPLRPRVRLARLLALRELLVQREGVANLLLRLLILSNHARHLSVCQWFSEAKLLMRTWKMTVSSTATAISPRFRSTFFQILPSLAVPRVLKNRSSVGVRWMTRSCDSTSK